MPFFFCLKPPKRVKGSGDAPLQPIGTCSTWAKDGSFQAGQANMDNKQLHLLLKHFIEPLKP